MMAIPLTVIGIMPASGCSTSSRGGTVAGFANPTFFTATGMIGMIARGGHRDAELDHHRVTSFTVSLARGATLFDAILNSCVVRLRPILLTASVAMLSALPSQTDPIFSGLAWSLIFGLLARRLHALSWIPVDLLAAVREPTGVTACRSSRGSRGRRDGRYTVLH